MLLLNISPIYAASWVLIKDEEGIKVYTRQNANTFIRSAKGVVKLNIKLDDLLTLLSDTQQLPKWLHNNRHARVLKQLNIVERYDYIITDLPWPNWDRDVIVHSTFRQNRESKEVVITFDAIPDAIPLARGLVRVRQMTGKMTLTPQKDGIIQMSYEVNADPGGRIPKWLINEMSIDFPFYSLKNLRDLIGRNF